MAELAVMFPDDNACVEHLARLRWPDGFVCQPCGVVDDDQRLDSRLLRCRACRRETRLTAGTVFEGTRTPLVTWFQAAWLAAAAKPGVSAKTLERTLGVRYRTAWALLHRLRVAMVRAERPRLEGVVEVDETFVGGVRHKMGRGPVGKFCVAVAVEVLDPVGFGRVRLRYLPHEEAEYLVPFVCDTVEPGSQVRTDGARAYDALPGYGYQRHAVSLASSPRAAHDYLPAAHRVASLLKRWLLGTYQGSTDPAHLQSYLEEFTFRFNRRNSTHRGLLFHRLLEQAIATSPVPEHSVVWGWHTPPLPTPVGGGPHRVVLAEGSPIVAALLRSDLAEDERFSVIAWHDDPRVVAAQARQAQPDLLIIDAAHRPAVADSLSRACPRARVLINDPAGLWNAQRRRSRDYPVIDTAYRYGQLADVAASLAQPQKVPF